MPSVMKNKFFSYLLLSFIFLFIGSSAAQAVDVPDLSWERGRQQSVTLGGDTKSILWSISLDGFGQSIPFSRSSVNDAGFIVYSIEIPEKLPVGRYQIVVRGPNTPPSTTGYVNILNTVAYDPLSDPRGVGVIAVAAFTLLAFFAGNKSESENSEQEDEEEEDSSALGSVDTYYQGIKIKHRGRGDDSVFVRSSFARTLDGWRHVAVLTMARRSPLTMRVSADGSYLQAVIGPLAIALPVLGIALGVWLGASTSIANSLIPTALAMVLLIVIVGILDALSGLLAFVSYLLVILARGGIDNVADVRTLLGFSLLLFTPSLAAGATRPLRRARDDWDAWERITDVLVSTLLTTWAIKSMVLALDGFARQKTDLATHSTFIAVVGGSFIFARYLLEEFVSRYAPARMEYMTPAKVASQDFDSFLITQAVRAGLFIFFMIGFFGLTWQIFAAVAILVVPSILKRFDSKLPNVPVLFQIIPGGIPSIVVMSFIGFMFSNWVNTLPLLAEDKTKTIVIITSIPGLVIGLLKLFGRSAKPGDSRWYRRDNMKWLYRTGGPVLLAVALLITIGVIP
jgi:hypothetical protein